MGFGLFFFLFSSFHFFLCFSFPLTSACFMCCLLKASVHGHQLISVLFLFCFLLSHEQMHLSSVFVFFDHVIKCADEIMGPERFFFQSYETPKNQKHKFVCLQVFSIVFYMNFFISTFFPTPTREIAFFFIHPFCFFFLFAFCFLFCLTSSSLSFLDSFFPFLPTFVNRR